ncbi:MAG: Gfo/Idh/MocA family protein [Ktedonobacterales bacterium]
MAIRIAQVGMGGWGRNWSKHIVPRVAGVEAVAWVDPEPTALALAQAEGDIPTSRCFGTLEETLQAVEADAVLITAALPGHVSTALTALAAGKHVLVEKPFAATVEEAQRVVAEAEKRQRVLMVSQNYRFFPAVQTVKSLVREGALGAPGVVTIDFRRDSSATPDGKTVYQRSQHPLLMDMAIHHFDLMRYVLGQEPRTITCHAWNPEWSPFDDPATALATITFDGGAVVSYRASWVSRGPVTPWAGEWNMECSGGEIAWTSRESSSSQHLGEVADRVIVRRTGEAEHKLTLPTLPAVDRLGSLSAFAEAITSGREPDSSGRENLGTLALMTAAIAAAQRGTPVSVPVGV